MVRRSFVYVPKACMWTSRCRRTSASTPRPWVSSSARSSSRTKLLRALLEGCTAPIWSETRCTPPSSRSSSKARPRALHHRAELVEQRLQPRHPACLRARGRTMEWSTATSFQGHHEVPACILAEPYAKASTMSLGFAGKASTRTRREDDSPRPAHQLHHRRQVHSRGGGRSAYRVWSKSSRARTVRPTRPCAMPCWSTTSPAPIPTRMSTFAKTTFRWPTKPPFPRFPKTSSST